jgi:hypothetical protein
LAQIKLIYNRKTEILLHGGRKHESTKAEGHNERNAKFSKIDKPDFSVQATDGKED